VKLGIKEACLIQMKTLKEKILKGLAWLFWKLRVTAEKDYVNFLITMKALEAELRMKEVPVSDKNGGCAHKAQIKGA